jgi:hypothetical protein
MNRPHRDVFNLIRNTGGRNVTLTHGGKHSRIGFIDKAGKRRSMTISKGSKRSPRAPASDRSQLRKMFDRSASTGTQK